MALHLLKRVCCVRCCLVSLLLPPLCRFVALLFCVQLNGTIFKPMIYRLMGAHLGKRPYLGHAIITEPDLVHMGDHVTVENGGTCQVRSTYR